MTRSKNIYSYIVCIAFALVFMVGAATYEYVAAKVVPMIISGLVILLAGIGIARELSKRKKPLPAKGEPQAAEQAGKPQDPSWPRLALAGAWMVGFFLVILVFGFLVAVPVFLLSYMIYHGTKWYTAALITVVSSAALYSVFVLLLRVNIYRGLVFG